MHPTHPVHELRDPEVYYEAHECERALPLEFVPRFHEAEHGVERGGVSW